jgi:hypothetical protein
MFRHVRDAQPSFEDDAGVSWDEKELVPLSVVLLVSFSGFPDEAVVDEEVVDEEVD